MAPAPRIVLADDAGHEPVLAAWRQRGQPGAGTKGKQMDNLKGIRPLDYALTAVMVALGAGAALDVAAAREMTGM